MSFSKGLCSSETHNRAVSTVADQVRTFYESKTPFRVYHGSTNSTRKSQFRHDNIVDVSKLNNILAIDVESKTVYVEPNVPMDKLVAETLKESLIPPVVMEFPGITAGGGFAGTSGESSSFRHGLFDRTVKFIEIVLGDGEVLFASESENADLFWGTAASFGTVGVVTLLALELVTAKPYVLLTYITIGSIEEAVATFQAEVVKQELDYLDGIMLSKNHGVLCLGKLADRKPDNIEERRFSRPWDDWFYINAEKHSAFNQTWTECIPLQDYLFRYERGAFWISKYTFHYFAVPLNKFTRWLLDKYTHTRIMYNALHHSGLSNRYIIQDVAVPYEKCSDFVSYLDENFRHYPLWLCPLFLRGKSPSSAYGLLAEREACLPKETASNHRPDMMLNFGVWGPEPKKHSDFIAWNIAFEAKIRALGGHKWLYAHTYYTEEEFWSMYDRKQYDEVRGKYHAEHLPSIYEKVRVDRGDDLGGGERGWWEWVYEVFWGIWPLRGFYGWLLCILTEEYLLPKRGRSFWGSTTSSVGGGRLEKDGDCQCGCGKID